MRAVASARRDRQLAAITHRPEALGLINQTGGPNQNIRQPTFNPGGEGVRPPNFMTPTTPMRPIVAPPGGWSSPPNPFRPRQRLTSVAAGMSTGVTAPSLSTIVGVRPMWYPPASGGGLHSPGNITPGGGTVPGPGSGSTQGGRGPFRPPVAPPPPPTSFPPVIITPGGGMPIPGETTAPGAGGGDVGGGGSGGGSGGGGGGPDPYGTPAGPADTITAADSLPDVPDAPSSGTNTKRWLLAGAAAVAAYAIFSRKRRSNR